ncbi:upstream-binding factor 1-like protein 1 [Tamandua tetradactyla]|uniref:upstream-binding factor 1-like protein 1 n=1 Tax=Tamandua tetradactyla TaxID=48850 RepID=UPI0040548D9F
MKFFGEPMTPPMNGYYKFDENLWDGGVLYHISEREHIVVSGRCWQYDPESLKKQYEKLDEKLQQQYKVEVDLWIKSFPPKEYVTYRESTCRNMDTMGGLSPKSRWAALQAPSLRNLSEGHGEGQRLQTLGTDSSETIWVDNHPSQGSEEIKKEDGEDDDGIKSSDSSSGVEDEDSGSEGSSSSQAPLTQTASELGPYTKELESEHSARVWGVFVKGKGLSSLP